MSGTFITQQQMTECQARITVEYYVTFCGERPSKLDLQAFMQPCGLVERMMHIVAEHPAKPIAQQAYRALNFVVWQSLVERHLPSNVERDAIEQSQVRISTGTQGMARQVICDAIALRLAECRYVHTKDRPFLMEQSDRRTAVTAAFFATVRVLTQFPLGTAGADLLLRTRLLGGVEALGMQFPSPSILSTARESLHQGTGRSEVVKMMRLAMHTRSIFQPKTLWNVRPVAPAPHLALVK